MMRTAFRIICLLLAAASFAFAQEMVIVPNGVLENGDKAEVTGDYVRIRTGPSLQHKILTKVNRTTPVTVIERDKKITEIGGVKNYWYHIKLDKSGIEGWIWGRYLRKRKIAVQKPEKLPIVQPETPVVKTVQPSLSFIESGTIDEKKSLVTSGDLNGNGRAEIIFINRENRRSFWNITGYEVSSEGLSEENQEMSFTTAYKGTLRSPDVKKIGVFSETSSGHSFIELNSDIFTYVYSYNPEKKAFYLASKINSPLVASGRLDGERDYLVFLKKNRSTDSDGTVTYEIQAATYESIHGRIRLRERIEYPNPLPVKKIITYDLDGDGADEIICEIGGRTFGGGITVLKFKEGSVDKVLNSGIPTYKDMPFAGMWGKTINSTPSLIVYSTDPDSQNSADTSMGFVFATLDANLLHTSFKPVNKMLDDVNNNRTAVLYDTDIEDMPFLLLDFDETANRYSIKSPVLE